MRHVDSQMRPILGYEGIYSIHISGRVFSHRAGRFLKNMTDAYGYHYVSLQIGGRRKNEKIHRLILKYFGPSMPEDKICVNHIDGDKKNNDLSNLEWCNHTENMIHSHRVLGNPKPPSANGKTGALSKLSIPVVATHRDTGETLRFESIRQADRSGFRLANVRASINGKVNHYKGYVWKRDIQ